MRLLLAVGLGACAHPQPTAPPEKAVAAQHTKPIVVAAQHPKPIVVDGRVGHGQVTYAVFPHFQKTGNMKGGPRHWTAVAKICVDPLGEVYDVTITRSSGDADFDEHVVSMIKQWRHRPYSKGGQAVSFCYLFRSSYAWEQP